jgi:glycine cleavage system regulatory protein
VRPEATIKRKINIVRQLEKVFDLHRIMLKELKGKTSSSYYSDSAKKK